MTIKWFLSGKVRHATEMCKHVGKMLASQRDILSPEAVGAVETAVANTRKAIDDNVDAATLDKQLAELEKVANAKLKPYPSASWRENVEVLLVAIAVAMAIRTFFLQPFKIPTASMQPTLYGVTTENHRANPGTNFPSGFSRWFDGAVRGTFYHEVYAPDDCELVDVRFKQVARFINKHEFVVRLASGQLKTISHTFSADVRLATQDNWAELHPGMTFRKGDPIVKLVEITGDHLFVDRLTYNFRRPKRGEIIVFKTKGIRRIDDQNQFYIKRLVGLGSETLQIGPDRRLIVNGRPLTASDPGFENLYSFSNDQPIQHSIYSGHGHAWELANPEAKYEILPDHYFALGDNTSVSSDSRRWGEFPQENVIGKSFFVYWPIANRGGSRFGLGYR